MSRKRKKPPISHTGGNATCHWCERQLQSTIANSTTRATKDHVIPESLGGVEWVWACFTCNNLKADMTPEEWEEFRLYNPKWWMLYPRFPYSKPKYQF